MSTLCSLAIFRTSGDERVDLSVVRLVRRSQQRDRTRRFADVAAQAEQARSALQLARLRGAGGAEGFGAGRFSLLRSRGGAAAGLAPASPITATTVFTSTVSPSFARISVITPAAGDGISASTLSVEISNSGSSRSTVSPTFLIQRTIVPSAIDSPICGITTSVGIVDP